jgi:hypothetical protein
MSLFGKAISVASNAACADRQSHWVVSVYGRACKGGRSELRNVVVLVALPARYALFVGRFALSLGINSYAPRWREDSVS